MMSAHARGIPPADLGHHRMDGDLVTGARFGAEAEGPECPDGSGQTPIANTYTDR
jgi:hypothetical protein